VTCKKERNERKKESKGSDAKMEEIKKSMLGGENRE